MEHKALRTLFPPSDNTVAELRRQVNEVLRAAWNDWVKLDTALAGILQRLDTIEAACTAHGILP
jgi:hypothetical protein